MMSSTAAQKKLAGVVVSAGKMMKTVKVRVMKDEWNRRLKRHFAVPYNLLVNDPNNSILEGDIITVEAERHSKHVLHTVSSIVAPFSKPADQRPPLMSREEREVIINGKREAKLERRRARVLEELEKAAAQGRKRGTGKKGRHGVKVIDDGGEGPGKGFGSQGRLVLPGGKHKFGGINEEALLNKGKAQHEMEKGRENERQREEVEAKREEEIQKEELVR